MIRAHIFRLALLLSLAACAAPSPTPDPAPAPEQLDAAPRNCPEPAPADPLDGGYGGTGIEGIDDDCPRSPKAAP